jgi:uncharacterized protein YaaR (DUF327 family)
MLPIPNLPRLQPGKVSPSRTEIGSKSKSGVQGQSGSTGGVSFLQEPPEFKQDFLELLEAVAPSGQDLTREINELWRDLPNLEKSLIQERSDSNLQNYKKQVQALLKAILAKNAIVEKHYTNIRGSSQKKEYSVIKIMDSKLKILAETIAHPQNSAFQILRQLDSIKGLLLDIRR